MSGVITINGERTQLPDEKDLTLGESEEVAKHLGIDLGASLPMEQFMGLVFVAIRRKHPQGAIVDQVASVRAMKLADLDLKEEDAAADPLPVNAELDGRSETTRKLSGAPV
jgi:hypothetical protein